jgi:hypothetical protein
MGFGAFHPRQTHLFASNPARGRPSPFGHDLEFAAAILAWKKSSLSFAPE